MSRGGPDAGQREGEGYPSTEEGFQVRPIHKQSFEERLHEATRDDQRAECRGYILRTSALGARENQERTILQMVEQNGGRVHKAKPKPVLPISLGPWTRHEKLQEPMELSGPVGPRRKVEIPPAPLKRSSEPGTLGALEGCCPKATYRDDQYDPSRARKDGRLPLTSTVCHSAAYRRIPIRNKEAQKEFSPSPKFFRGRQGRNHPTP